MSSEQSKIILKMVRKAPFLATLRAFQVQNFNWVDNENCVLIAQILANGPALIEASIDK